MLWFKFARRYMFSPKSHSVINIIASVSVLAVAVPTAAIIILMAMFDGLVATIEECNHAVDADIEICAARGQTFYRDSLDFEQLMRIEGVEASTAYIEQSVMAVVGEHRATISLRGVDDTYSDVIALDEHFIMGDMSVVERGQMVLSSSVAAELGVHHRRDAEINLYALNRKQISTLLPTSGISRSTQRLGGEVVTNAENDAMLAIADVESVQKLLNYSGRLSCVAIKLANDADAEAVRDELQRVVGKDFEVLTREDKNAATHAILRIEKFAILLIGMLIAVVAAFSIIGSVLMLITEKQRDIATLRTMGASRSLVTRIFVGEGMLLTIVGCLIGTILGVGFALGQQHFGWIKIPGNMIVESYPVALNPWDVVVVNAIMLLIGLAISSLTVRAKIKG